MAAMPPIGGVLFDKDGTLFSYQATWGPWTAGMIADLAPGDTARQADMAHRLGFDLETGEFLPGSLAIAGTAAESAEALRPALPGWSSEALRTHLIAESLSARPAEAVPLVPFLARLQAAGLALGVATNDAETAARGQLQGLSLEARFDFIAGYDSGYGAKPAPGMCAAFADHVGLAPARVVMVGDSPHDLEAGRAAGMRTVAVLTGVYGHADLAPLADAVFPDIGHLPDWLGL